MLYLSYLPIQKIYKHIKHMHSRYPYCHSKTQQGYQAHLQEQPAVSNFRYLACDHVENLRKYICGSILKKIL